MTEYSAKTLNLMADLLALTRSEHETEQDRLKRMLTQQDLHNRIVQAALEDAEVAAQEALRHRRPYPVVLHQNAFALARGPLTKDQEVHGAEAPEGDFVVTIHNGNDRLNMVLEPELFHALFQEVPQSVTEDPSEKPGG